MSDILRTLRIIYENNGPVECGEAADEIERLRERLAKAESIIIGLYAVPECRAYYDKYIKEKQP